MNWENQEPPAKVTGLGVMRALCDVCGEARMIAMDRPLLQTMAICLGKCTPKRKDYPKEFWHLLRPKEVQHTCEVYLKPGPEADKFIAEHNLNPDPISNPIPPKPWAAAGGQ